MMCDARDVPLDPFEEALLSDLRAAQAEAAAAPAMGARIVKLRSRRRYGWAVVGVAAAAAVGLITVDVAGTGSNTASAAPVLPKPLAVHHGSRAAAVQFLERTAATQSHTAPGVGRVQYAETQNYAMETTVAEHRSSTAVQTTVRRTWRSANGATLVREYTQDTTRYGSDLGGLKALSSIDHSGSSGPGAWPDDNAGLPATTTAYLHALDDEVAHSISQDHPVDGATRNFTIGDLVSLNLQTGTASPQQVAGNYKLLASAPGVFYAGHVSFGGHSGIAVGLMISDPATTISTGTDYFIINPATGTFLGVEDIDTPGAPPALHLPFGPTVAQYNFVESAGRVDTVGTVPTQ